VVTGLVLLAATGGAAAYALDRSAPPPARSVPVPERRLVATPADRAVAELTDAVRADAGVPRRQAGCVARRLLAAEGLERLVGAGVVATDGRFLDPDLTGRPDVRRALVRAARGCR
jgi:hypothetical protein